MGMGSTNKASEAAQRAEAERQAAIKRTQGAVNGVFDSPARQAEIGDYVNATRDFYTQGLNRQKVDTDRELRFALARGGLTGGSTQNDQAKRFAETYTRGLLDVERRAQGAGANVAAADQEARARYIALATSGLDATTAAAQSAAAMRTNLEAGQADRTVGSWGDAFAIFKPFIDRSRDAAERRRSDSKFASLYGSPAPSGFGFGG